MTPENFVYWLNGFIELENPVKIDKRQTQEIKNHLALVLKKETPSLRLSEIKYTPIQPFVQTTDHICNRLNKTGSCNYCDEREKKTEEYNANKNKMAKEVLDKYKVDKVMSDSKDLYCMKDDVNVYQNMNYASC